MARWLPYPLLTASLLTMWLLLNGLSPGHIILGSVIAVFASLAMVALRPIKTRIRHWSPIPRLLLSFLDDVFRSNIAVAVLILRGSKRQITSGFVTIPLELRDRTGLSLLSCIITSTPGTAWVDYNAARDQLIIHVLDLTDEQRWIDTIKRRYERPLLEIFQ